MRSTTTTTATTRLPEAADAETAETPSASSAGEVDSSGHAGTTTVASGEIAADGTVLVRFGTASPEVLTAIASMLNAALAAQQET